MRSGNPGMGLLLPHWHCIVPATEFDSTATTSTAKKFNKTGLISENVLKYIYICTSIWHTALVYTNDGLSWNCIYEMYIFNLNTQYTLHLICMLHLLNTLNLQCNKTFSAYEIQNTILNEQKMAHFIYLF